MAGIELRESAALSFQGLLLPGNLWFGEECYGCQLQFQLPSAKTSTSGWLGEDSTLLNMFDCRRLQQLLLSRSLGKGLFP